MNERSEAILDAALLVYSMDELQNFGKQQRGLLFSALALEMGDTVRKMMVAEMQAFRRRMEATHFHPALAASRRVAQSLADASDETAD